MGRTRNRTDQGDNVTTDQAYTIENTEDQALTEASTTETPAQAEAVKRGKPAPIVTGDIVVVEDADQSTSGRVTRMDTDPVALAVKNATPGTWVRLKTDGPDKVKGVKSLLRRAAGHYDVGINIDPRDLGTDVRFRTGPKKANKNTVTEGIVGEPTVMPDEQPQASDPDEFGGS